MRGAPAGFAAVVVGVGLAAGAVAYVSSDSDHGRRLPERWQRGFNLTAFQPDAYGGAASERAMLTARATGSSLLALVPTWHMASATASEVVADPAKTPTQESLIAAAAKAAEVGLDVTVKPHVDLADGSFRGEIAPADREAWFESYEVMLLGSARAR